jgi:hypothetical protein
MVHCSAEALFSPKGASGKGDKSPLMPPAGFLGAGASGKNMTFMYRYILLLTNM